jgi:DNA-binding transcriptional LysR family regulator
VQPRSLASKVLLREPFVLLRARTEAGSPIALDGRPVVAFEPCTSQRAVEERLQELGLSPGLVSRLEDTATIHAFVEAGAADALVPRLAVLDADVDAQALLDLPHRTVVLIWQEDRLLPPEALRFAELALEAAASLA